MTLPLSRTHCIAWPQRLPRLSTPPEFPGSNTHRIAGKCSTVTPNVQNHVRRRCPRSIYAGISANRVVAAAAGAEGSLQAIEKDIATAGQILRLGNWDEGIAADLDEIVAQASLEGGAGPYDAPDQMQTVATGDPDRQEQLTGYKRHLSKAFCELSPTWRLILLSDGSVTRHVRTLSMKDVKVDTFNVDTVHVERVTGNPPGDSLPLMVPAPNGNASSTDSAAAPSVPKDVEKILSSSKSQTVLQRETWLSVGDQRLVYAVSWWDEATYKRYMQQEDRTIWENLRDRQAELYREICMIYRSRNAKLSRDRKTHV